MGEWAHKDEWSRRGKDFLVKISRHSAPRFDYDESLLKMVPLGVDNKWCLYAFIFDKHPHFQKFEGDSMWQSASDFFDWHGGCTFLEYHRGKNLAIGSVQVGCDYSHLHDDRFLEMATKEDAEIVFRDADDLFETLTKLGAA